MEDTRHYIASSMSAYKNTLKRNKRLIQSFLRLYSLY